MAIVTHSKIYVKKCTKTEERTAYERLSALLFLVYVVNAQESGRSVSLGRLLVHQRSLLSGP
jgi:hypothetical protein